MDSIKKFQKKFYAKNFYYFHPFYTENKFNDIFPPSKLIARLITVANNPGRREQKR